MDVKILDVETKSQIKSQIYSVTKGKSKLPSIIDGWRFNFSKHSKKKDYQTYVLTTDKTPEIIEGCLIINTKSPYQVYMAFVEVAPHNRGNEKKYEKVAGCLIAYACRQSFINGQEGYLAFDVLEEREEDEIKLMNMYSQKYNAVRLDNSTTMIILPEGSENLISEYLK
ncbi:hypothetical protein [Cyclobacterium qasimii]|uniref:Uncharacterized protein n=2 Tax=Cyclobacterium qasimii TaxID=1350429 RepID=A0A512CJ10_9BACT|nr:hypothetical protein [Cyclobacterium qasimii]GEO24204.1 hypothetical protein CQA01_47380 [Cyclobacterium qasimii]